MISWNDPLIALQPMRTNAPLDSLLDALRREPAVLVEVVRTEGSAPREAGAWMAVLAQGQIGSIGGGHLEFDALTLARELLPLDPVSVRLVRVALGPSLGQCCGGVVHLRYRRLDASHREGLPAALPQRLASVALFGGGHVGRAIARQLGGLPFALHWIDSRDEIFPDDLAGAVHCEHSDPVQAAVDELAPGSRVLIMSFSHAEDLEILARCLRRQRERGDLSYIGLIGSRSKWATFRHRLESRGFGEADFSQVTCPIGVPGIAGKQPEVIAVAVAAQLLQTV